MPGEAAGLYALHRALGRLPLARVVAPAVELARRGFIPVPRLVGSSERIGAKLAPDEPMRRWLYPNGNVLTPGARVVRAALAATLARFGKEGERAIYRGPIADSLVATVRAHGGDPHRRRISRGYAADVARAARRSLPRQLDLRPAPARRWRERARSAAFPRRAARAGRAGALGSAKYLHRVAEALKHAFADRARWLGDPAFVKVPRQAVSAAYGQRAGGAILRRPRAAPSTTMARARARPAEPPHDHGTTHVCVADGEGNVVALTTTVNLELGARLEDGRSGMVLNDQMDDFVAEPGKPNELGLLGSEANAIAPGKKPVSSMSPTLVLEDGAPLMAVGGSGGPTIISSVVQAIVDVVDAGDDAEGAVSQPRVYTQWEPDLLFVDEDIPDDVVAGLAKRGHHIVRSKTLLPPAAQMILRKGGELEAASDPRKGGAPAAP